MLQINGTYLYGRQWADEEKIMETKSLSESTICCFGDSTTWGDNGCGGGGNDISWTSHLGALLGGAVIENFSRNVPLGELGSTDVHEFYGALDYLIRTITARSPRAKLVFMTPCKTSGKHEKDIPASDELNHLGLT